jgi:hypothetical protein
MNTGFREKMLKKKHDKIGSFFFIVRTFFPSLMDRIQNLNAYSDNSCFALSDYIQMMIDQRFEVIFYE